MSLPCPAGSPGSRPYWATGRLQFSVNRLSISIPVMHMRGPVGDHPSQRLVGWIAPNDYFRWEWDEGSPISGWPEIHRVLIRNSAGQLEWGWLSSHEVDANKWTFFSAIINFPLHTFTWNGLALREYHIQNRPAELRRPDGTLHATLAVGTRIAAEAPAGGAIRDPMGVNWCTHWRIAAVWISQAGELPRWVWATGTEHGFVHTGLPENRPGTSTIRTALA